MRKAIYICLTVFFIACSTRPVPEGILMPDKMEKVVYDIVKSDQYLNDFVSKDTTVNIKKQRSILYEKVFKLHDTNRREFYTSYKYYQQHPDMQKTLFDSISAKAGRGNAVSPHIVPVKSGKLNPQLK